MTNSSPWKPWPIEIDALPNLKMVDLSMANCECHNQMVPSGKRLHNYGKIHHAINGKTHYRLPFSIAMLVITRG